MRDRKKRITVVIMICILLVVVSGCSKEKSSDTLEEVQQREKTESVEVSDETENKADETEQTVDTEPVNKAGSEGVIYVFVCGQVASPGVYELPEGSRICQAIDAAGGMLDTASTDWVNQAETAEDGRRFMYHRQKKRRQCQKVRRRRHHRQREPMEKCI
ncbi:SLBB domain-containing protein [Dorea sp. AM58-8]|uniref:SLBB domain-containing protein n=1 Tax=Dorea sp. AM58-8 TaxID=2292346 RepID=UPI001FA8EF26|nr:SLBB domain-containing protein [Dorea sp. AM58-8]